MNRNKKTALVVFIKNAVKGKVKTRLAKSIGETAALTIYQQLLQLTLAATEKLDCKKYVYYSDKIEEGDQWKEKDFIQRLQEGNDLGERMENAFLEVFQDDAEQVIIIGSDCPQITTALLEKAFDKLHEKEAVIGPAIDGGYYLLGMNQLESRLFENKQWSTSSVFKDTLSDFEKLQWTFEKLPVLRDVDLEEDLEILPQSGKLT